MKLNKIWKGILLVLAVICGISLFVLLEPDPAFSTAADYSIIGDNFGFNDTDECTGLDLHYLDGATTVAITLTEQRERNWDWVCIMYETASDVWDKQSTGITLKDSDSDGYVDWISFDTTNGATAGGEVRIRWVSIENGMPGI